MAFVLPSICQNFYVPSFPWQRQLSCTVTDNPPLSCVMSCSSTCPHSFSGHPSSRKAHGPLSGPVSRKKQFAAQSAGSMMSTLHPCSTTPLAGVQGGDNSPCHMKKKYTSSHPPKGTPCNRCPLATPNIQSTISSQRPNGHVPDWMAPRLGGGCAHVRGCPLPAVYSGGNAAPQLRLCPEENAAFPLRRRAEKGTPLTAGRSRSPPCGECSRSFRGRR